MRRRDAGFTYPLTLCLLIIFILFFSMQIEQFMANRKLSHETGTILLEEYYLHASVIKVEGLLQKEGTIPARGTYDFQKGGIVFIPETINGNVQSVNFTLTLQSGEIVIGRGYFDMNLKKFIRWVEL
ncbi:competence type IV pilus minor pilin ComGG [Neobacillus dielmonensis]|uniref:competence type IV pilus minor pilin ComGG n=1 Tax=Neobacillus dielmonensis TaxID=1347369 RepID=UPI0005A91EDE|nr:competence type IV pilus minor pilin ComGG [Neobacillus dielmonensis]